MSCLPSAMHLGRQTVLGVERPAVISGLVSLVLLLSACRTTTGATFDHSMTLVSDQPQNGAHRTMDYRIDFSYTFWPGAGDVPGRMDFSGRIVTRRGLDTFILRLHFLDDVGNILGTQVLYAPGARRGAGRPSISRQYEVPAGAVNMGFTHVAREPRLRPRRN